MEDLNDILIGCAQIRGCYPLMHRTLSEFSWFCKTCIYGWTDMDQYEMDEIITKFPDMWNLWSDAKGEKDHIKDTWGSAYNWGDAELINLAKAFREYCHEQYDGVGE